MSEIENSSVCSEAALPWTGSPSNNICWHVWRAKLLTLQRIIRVSTDDPKARWRYMVAILVFIVAVSAYDSWLVARYALSMQYMEQNPMGRLLIEWNCGEVGLFIRAKAAGTILSVGSMVLMAIRRPKLATQVASGVGLVQFILLFYLTCW